eukprot:scaffold69324_cov56-Attheya_sp.AAC.1
MCAENVLLVKPLDEKDKNTKLVSFDVIVCATGFSYPTLLAKPGQSYESRKEEIATLTKSVLEGTGDIVVGGGGAVGVEIAGDLLEQIKKPRKVIIVSSTDRLVADLPEIYSKRVLTQLISMGAKVIFNTRVESHSETTVSGETPMSLTLRSGKTLKNVSAYVAGFSRGPNTAFLKDGVGLEDYDGAAPLPSGILDESGRVMVNSYLQSPAYPALFAMGAASNLDEPTLAPMVAAQAITVAANIVGATATTTHKPGPAKAPMYVLTGHHTYGTWIPESIPPGKFLFGMCGFPCNMLCPCFCLAALCGPMDPFMCGWCCGTPDGPGLPNTLMNVKEKNVFATSMGYTGVGKPSVTPVGKMSDMER